MHYVRFYDSSIRLNLSSFQSSDERRWLLCRRHGHPLDIFKKFPSHGSVRVRTLRRGSVRVRNAGQCQFSVAVDRFI